LISQEVTYFLMNPPSEALVRFSEPMPNKRWGWYKISTSSEDSASTKGRSWSSSSATIS